MGCGSCGTGKPNGCKSNGGCSTGGCNRMNVHDWLANIPLADAENECNVIEVSFNKGSRKDFFRNSIHQYFEKGDYVTVEGVGGIDVGEVSLSGELVRMQMKKRGIGEHNPEMKKVLRPSSEKDIENFESNKNRQPKMLARSREIAIELKLEMKLSEIEIQADGKKATFFYTADDRVDFREMIKMFASEFKVKVEMRQIGIRQEAAKMGGIGSCGRELCCSTWLTDFKSVNTTAARYQNLSINQTKLSGQCGRLKCCLNFELDTYLDALQHFPENVDTLEIAKGTANLVKKDIFKNIMWYILPGNSHFYPLSLSRVKEIKRLNGQGIKPEGLEPMDLTSGKEKDVEPVYADLVGHITLKALEKGNNRDRDNRNRNDRGVERRNDNRGEKNANPQQKQQQQQHQKQQPPQRNVTLPRDNNNNISQRNNQPKSDNNLGGQRPNNNRPPQNRPPQNRGPQQNRPPQNRPPRQEGNAPKEGEG